MHHRVEGHDLLIAKIYRMLDHARWKRNYVSKLGYLSRANIPTGMYRTLLRQQFDVLNLHWLGSNTLTIEEIGRLNVPTVWTMHDMWPFCGAEHYVAGADERRYREGYDAVARIVDQDGPDMEGAVWKRKARAWRHSMHVVTPSTWLRDCVAGSRLMRDWPVTVIPYPLDTDFWMPLGKEHARQVLGLPQDERILLFSALGGMRDPRKGFDLLLASLGKLAARGADNVRLLVMGDDAALQDAGLPYPVTSLGLLHDDLSMRTVNSAADISLVASRQDNLPLSAIESASCGLPVVAFAIGGLGDIVRHTETGYLARPFDTDDFADGIAGMLHDPALLATRSAAARRLAVSTYAPQRIGQAYTDLYTRVLEKHPPGR